MENIKSDLIRGNIDTIILRCLQIGDMYGLEICNYIKQASNGTYILKQPTLYSALKRLEGRGYISSYWQDSAIGGRRHYYKLTEAGKQTFAGRKDQWSVSKEVIDSLVDDAAKRGSDHHQVATEETEEEITQKPVLPIDCATCASAQALAPVPHTVTMGMAINPYNPFAESDDDYLTLPFRILEKGESQTDPQPSKQLTVKSSAKTLDAREKQDLPPLLKFAMGDGALSGITTDTVSTKPPSPDATAFAKYISPDDYAFSNTLNAGLYSKTAKIANYDIKIQPFVKHYDDRKRGDFHYIAKLRLAAAFIMALVLIAVLVVAQYNLKPTLQEYSGNEKFFFVLAYVGACLYFVYYLVLFVANPGTKKALHNQTTEHTIRLITFLGAVITILAINVLAGLSHINSPDFLVYWAIPCIFAAAVYLEGVVQYSLRKTNLFVA
jgi:PadR family transcriptional regulator PadR